MLKFIIKRTCASIPTMLMLITVSLFLMWLAPGSPPTGEHNPSPAVMANTEAKYRLNDPIYPQYFHYLKQLTQGDLGPSFKYKDFNVNELLAQSLPVPAELGPYAFLVTAIFGMFIGIIAALKQNSRLDYALMSGAMTGIVVPSFVTAPVLVLVFAVRLQWLSAGDWNDGTLMNLILPVVISSIGYVSGITRITRGAMIEVLNSPFTRTARVKGLPMSCIILRHALRPAMLPIASFLGPAFVSIITGFTVIENVFGTPGVGQLFVNGVLNRDYSMILGLAILVGIMTTLFNAILDILCTVIDPKIRY